MIYNYDLRDTVASEYLIRLRMRYVTVRSRMSHEFRTKEPFRADLSSGVVKYLVLTQDSWSIDGYSEWR